MNRVNCKTFKSHCSFCRGKRSSPIVQSDASHVSDRKRRRANLLLSNIRFARATWGAIPRIALNALATLTKGHGLSVATGDLQFLDGRWYVTHSGLLRIALRRHCTGIRTELERDLCNTANNHWVFKATVYKIHCSRGFVGYGDADPSNVSSLVHGAEMRVAETRAVNRALRKAYGIGLCSVEELGWAPRSKDSGSPDQRGPIPSGNNGQNAQPRLRDRLCLLIRQHKLDANLVKAYAADYCGTATLREASRDMVEAFINDLALRAAKDLDGLICQLNSYAKSQEVAS
jgi:hypothetical protein